MSNPAGFDTSDFFRSDGSFVVCVQVSSAATGSIGWLRHLPWLSDRIWLRSMVKSQAFRLAQADGRQYRLSEERRFRI